MLSVSPVVKIFLYGQAADLRRGYDGLASIVQESMEQDPLSGSLFVFVNKRANRIKLLYWNETGYAIWMKRLEVGTFELPRAGESEPPRVKITPSRAMPFEPWISTRSRRGMCSPCRAVSAAASRSHRC